MRKFTLLLPILLLSVVTAFGQWPAAGGPDAYGYTFETYNNTDPRYNWIDISTAGTEVSGLADDNVVGPVEVGFEFTFYWIGRKTVYIGSNGYISFAKGFNIASDPTIGFPSCPTPDENNELIAGMMNDLSFDGTGNTGRCYTWSNNADSFIVSFVDVPFWTNNAVGYAGANSFQYILNAADSTIKIQWLRQDGVWNSSYDAAANPLVVGIENVTGNIGLMVANNEYPPAESGVIFTPPLPSNALSIQDIEPRFIQTPSNAGFFLAKGGGGSVFSANVGNVGNADITSSTSVLATAEDTLGQQLYQSTVDLGGFNASTDTTFDFPIPFNPPFSGPYSLTVSTTNADDINPTNNSKTIEAIIVDTTGGTAVLQYISDNRTNIDGQSQWTNGNGNSGIGIYIEPPVYPAKITAIDVFIFPGDNDTVPDGGIRVAVYDDDPQFGTVPGPTIVDLNIPKENTVIWNRDPANGLLGAWNRIMMPTPINVTEGGFYVAWFHLNDSVSLANESATPISRRSYEILNGTWAPHRNTTSTDFHIRAIMDVSEADKGNGVRDQISDVTDFNVYPNPSTGVINYDLRLEDRNNVMVKVYNLEGRKMSLEIKHNVSELSGSIDLSSQPKGVYMVQVITNKGQAIKKVVLK